MMVFFEDTFPQGSIVECVIVGAIKAKQSSDDETVRNDRIIVVPALAVKKDGDVELEDFSKQKIKEIENFFVYYNKVEKKEFKPLGTLTAKETWKMIKEESEVT